MSKLKNNSYEISVFRGILKSGAFLNPPQSVKVRGHWQFYYHYSLEGTNMGRLMVSSRL